MTKTYLLPIFFVSGLWLGHRFGVESKPDPSTLPSCRFDVTRSDRYFDPNGGNPRCGSAGQVDVRDSSGNFIRCMNW